MRARRFVGTAGAVLAVVVTAGCGSGKADAVAWTDKVCGALLSFTDAVSTTQPAVDPNDPTKTVKSLSDYLGKASTALGTSITGLDAAGKSPVNGGDEVVSTLKGTLGKIKTSFDTSKTQLEAIDTTDTGSFATALPAAVAPLQELKNLADPTAGLKANNELNAAAAEAPNCKKAQSLGN